MTFRVPNLDGEFRRSVLHTGSVSPTKQYPKDECDINNILKQYSKTGIITHINRNSGSYLDLPSSVELQEAYELASRAEMAFADLPAKVRERFRNNPQLFLAAFNDPKMADELRELGLLNPLPPSEEPAAAAPIQQRPPAPEA